MARRVKAGRPKRKFENKHSQRKPTGRRPAQQRKRRPGASKKRKREEEEGEKYVESRKRRERPPKKEGAKRDYDQLTDDVESPKDANYDSSCSTGSVSGRSNRGGRKEESSSPPSSRSE
ncbi:hypothetical protein KC19_12G120700 [Ceratodon purpureus]|uniref:Uncharacterized protein n=1 Tax=Ceratodon purpureus TaxID=3225 RepID=A0A8T0G8P4_CERPU|nr:hypothetical protein KC19_12G120700 [Ceratodon purpureus]